MKTDIEQVRLKMQEFSDTAHALYDDICRDQETSLPDPVQWMYNQDRMRHMWLNVSKNFEGDMNAMLDHKVMKYMQHMYTKYPAGYGFRLQQAARDGKVVDSAKIYIKCLRGRPLPV